MLLFDDFDAFTHFIILHCTICESSNFAAIQINLCYVFILENIQDGEHLIGTLKRIYMSAFRQYKNEISNAIQMYSGFA